MGGMDNTNPMFGATTDHNVIMPSDCLNLAPYPPIAMLSGRVDLRVIGTVLSQTNGIAGIVTAADGCNSDERYEKFLHFDCSY